MTSLPHYTLPTFTSSTTNDESYELERVRASYASGVQSSLTRLDLLPTKFKAGSIDQIKIDHTNKNLRSHIQHNFAVRNVSKFEGFSSFVHIMEGNITNSINRQLQVASKPAFRPTSNSFQKGKYKDLLGDKVVAHPSTRVMSTIAQRSNNHHTVDPENSSSDDHNNLYINIEQPTTLPELSHIIRANSHRLVRDKSSYMMMNSMSRPKTASRHVLSPSSDMITNRIFHRYNTKSTLLSSSSPNQSKFLDSGRSSTKSHIATKTAYINDGYYHKLLSHWKDSIHRILQEDWDHIHYVIEYGSMGELSILFEVSYLLRASHIDSLKRYLDHFADHGFAHTEGLYRSLRRWGVIEYRPSSEDSNDSIEYLVFVLLPMRSMGEGNVASRHSTRQLRPYVGTESTDYRSC